MKKSYFVIFSCFLFLNAFSQSFTPIKLTGFNYDGVAEAAPAANFVSGSLDGSANALYSKAFALANDVPYGLEDPGSYTLLNLYKLQLQPYNQNNMLRVLSGQNATLNFVTPYKYNTLLLFCFNTESDNNISYTINFSDGTIQNGTSMVPDWFYGADPIAQGIGRISSYDDTTPGRSSVSKSVWRQSLLFPILTSSAFKAMSCIGPSCAVESVRYCSSNPFSLLYPR